MRRLPTSAMVTAFLVMVTPVRPVAREETVVHDSTSAGAAAAAGTTGPGVTPRAGSRQSGCMRSASARSESSCRNGPAPTQDYEEVWWDPNRTSTGQQRRVMIFIRPQEDGMIHSVRLPRTTSRSS
jgi:hypothetical protein